LKGIQALFLFIYFADFQPSKHLFQNRFNLFS